MVITRFSPSPTGNIHVGNIRTALINYLFTKVKGGKFILRMDDTDPKRSKAEYTESITADLKWLGIEWDEFYKQSDKLAYYAEVKEKLIADGKVYPCFETEEELALKRKSQLSRGVPPLYDRASLKLSEAEQQAKIAAGIIPHYRFKLDDAPVSWTDGIRGKISFKERAFSDPVVFRADGSPTYTFCSVIDDIDLAVTDVIRGEDHISNTAVQIQIFRALTDKLPNFHHLSLLKTREGEISKREGGFEVRALQKNGVHPQAINSLLSRLGSSLNVEPVKELADLTENFAMSNFSHSAIIYDERDILRLNQKLLAEQNFAEAQPFLQELNIKVDQDFWESVKANINSYLQVAEWQQIFAGDFKVAFTKEEQQFLQDAAATLPVQLNPENFKDWIKSVTEKTGKKGKELFHPLRLALTGQDSGPELSKIAPLLGDQEVKQRLTNFDE